MKESKQEQQQPFSLSDIEGLVISIKAKGKNWPVIYKVEPTKEGATKAYKTFAAVMKFLMGKGFLISSTSIEDEVLRNLNEQQTTKIIKLDS